MRATVAPPALKEIDLDFNKKVSFIEYCLWKYKKTLEQLFEEVSERCSTCCSAAVSFPVALNDHDAVAPALPFSPRRRTTRLSTF